MLEFWTTKKWNPVLLRDGKTPGYGGGIERNDFGGVDVQSDKRIQRIVEVAGRELRDCVKGLTKAFSTILCHIKT